MHRALPLRGSFWVKYVHGVEGVCGVDVEENVRRD